MGKPRRGFINCAREIQELRVRKALEGEEWSQRLEKPRGPQAGVQPCVCVPVWLGLPGYPQAVGMSSVGRGPSTAASTPWTAIGMLLEAPCGVSSLEAAEGLGAACHGSPRSTAEQPEPRALTLGSPHCWEGRGRPHPPPHLPLQRLIR